MTDVSGSTAFSNWSSVRCHGDRYKTEMGSNKEYSLVLSSCNRNKWRETGAHWLLVSTTVADWPLNAYKTTVCFNKSETSLFMSPNLKNMAGEECVFEQSFSFSPLSSKTFSFLQNKDTLALLMKW